MVEVTASDKAVNRGAAPVTYGKGERPPRGDYASARADYTCEQDWAAYSAADLGEEVALYRREVGVGGLRTQWWLLLHLRGLLYRLGRLQFEMWHRSDVPVLGTHIPEWGEP